MPVCNSSRNTDIILQTAVLSEQKGHLYFKQVEDVVTKLKGDVRGLPQKCSMEMTRQLITVIQEQLSCHQFQQAETMIKVIKYLASLKQEEALQNLSVLVKNGLFEILVFVFDKAHEHVIGNGQTVCIEACHLMEVFLQTLNDVAEISEEARKSALDLFAVRLMMLVTDTTKVFHTRMEAERTLNLLLEGCDDAAVESIIKKPAMEQMMNDLAKYLYTAGDFEMQIALTETLARLVKKSERHKYCALWFPSLAVGKAFLDIQDEQFDSDSRRFLNCLNTSCPQQSVISFSCKQAFLGNAELKSPNDENLSEFWVDFNSASHSITMYVADEESDAEEESGLWETVTYPVEKVVSYSILSE
ncbi:synaptonemal complex protein 2-like [Diadema setosum]|uniref:synaptonemal complex protein 2-like n=1 Tax=Diadema setosum TaxID=31175 RepID=UPI003B3A3279